MPESLTPELQGIPEYADLWLLLSLTCVLALALSAASTKDCA